MFTVIQFFFSAYFRIFVFLSHSYFGVVFSNLRPRFLIRPPPKKNNIRILFSFLWSFHGLFVTWCPVFERLGICRDLRSWLDWVSLACYRMVSKENSALLILHVFSCLFMFFSCFFMFSWYFFVLDHLQTSLKPVLEFIKTLLGSIWAPKQDSNAISMH